ncbi:MAG TPA: gluconate 2-dehydrogenase subunit 3 family protein [Blastocatellia bacterium]|nr:gluconate 2-dehydrogenase subunit 3 family protein [Blastocatellia bacterium]
MNKEELSRRLFLVKSLAGISGAWLALNMNEIIAAGQHAHHAAQATAPVKFEYFTPEQAAEVEAIAAQIIPTDDTPGAREARVVYFIDRALATFDKDKQPVYVKGLADIKRRAKRVSRKATKFSELTSDRQIKLLKQIEKSAFFDLVRAHTITGMFANPEYGGNYEKAGWKLIGFTDDFYYEPPFGHYDRDYKG